MKMIANGDVEEYEDLIFDLENLCSVWADMLTQHKHMAKSVEDDCGRKDCIARGLLIAMTFCTNEIETILKKYKDEE